MASFDTATRGIDPPPLRAADLGKIGGAMVRHPIETFINGEKVRLKQGEHLSADFVRAMPFGNVRAMQNSGFIQVYPKSAAHQDGPRGPLHRFVRGLGNNQYGVVEGYFINEGPLTKDEANKFANEGAN